MSGILGGGLISQLGQLLQATDDRAQLPADRWASPHRYQDRPWQEGVLWDDSRFPQSHMGGGIPSNALNQLQRSAWGPDDTGDARGSVTSEVSYLLHKTTQWMFNTDITTLATGTTIGTSSTYSSETQTLYCPETAERVIESVRVRVCYRTEFGVSGTGMAALRLVFTLGGTSQTFDMIMPTDRTALRNMVHTVDFDLTDFFKLNFGTGTSQTMSYQLTAASTSASNINQIVVGVDFTYGFDPNPSTTRIKTIRIPIQSYTNGLSASQFEIGTDGTNPAPSGQIPALDTFLPELSKTYRKIFLDLWAGDGAASGNSYTPAISIDGGADIPRATIDATQPTNMYWRDQYDLTGSITTNATHTLSMKSDTAGLITNKPFCPGGFLVVCYEYDHPSTVTNNLAIYEQFVPMTNPLLEGSPNQAGFTDGLLATGSAQDYLPYVLHFEIHEPGTPTLLQSGIVSFDNVAASNNPVIKAIGPITATRTYTVASNCSPSVLVQRMDLSAYMVSLQRGLNRILCYSSGSAGARVLTCGAYAVINYTAGINGDVDKGAHPVCYLQRTINSASTSGGGVQATRETPVRVPQLGSPYRLCGGGMVEAEVLSTGLIVVGIALEQRDGELDGVYSLVSANSPQTAACIAPMVFAITRVLNLDNLHTNKIDIQKRRRQVLYNTQNIMEGSWSIWLTYHQYSFTVSGTVKIGGAPVADGKTVKIYAQDLNNPVTPYDLVTTVQTSGGLGGFTATVPDNTRSYYAVYENDGYTGRSLLGTPT